MTISHTWALMSGSRVVTNLSRVVTNVSHGCYTALSKLSLEDCYKRFQACESAVLMSLKPKLLQKMYEHNGIRMARKVYEDFIKSPPTQIELHRTMIHIESAQENPNATNIRRCFEILVHLHGKTNVQIWINYITFEQNTGSAQNVPAIHRRAIDMLEKNLVDDFIKAQTLAKLNI